LFVATQDNMTASATISSIGATFGGKFASVQVHRTRTTFARAATYFYIINKIRIRHYSLKLIEKKLKLV
jgi:hypothetical protein